MNSNYIILSEKKWNNNMIKHLQAEFPDINWIRINKKEDFNYQKLSEINPEMIFIPHWSHIIPSIIFDCYECVVFHMTDLPFGRGGSPLQNLIIRGYAETKISALKVVEKVDSGPIYLKHELSLDGDAEKIFNRCSRVIQKMISRIIREKLVPSEQVGQAVYFKRRKPEDGNIHNLDSLKSTFDHIRMLDAEGYPKAFIELKHLTLEFSDVKYENDKSLKAYVRITKK